MKKALFVIDMQNDFMDNGFLPVKNSVNLIPKINDLMEQFDFILASQDWHSPNHASFLSSGKGGKWPKHCVQMIHGADFSVGLNSHKFNTTIRKGTDKNIESYSVFFDELG